MNTGVIDRFLETFTRYIDSGFGLLGGENAQDRLNSNECLRAYTEELLGVPTTLFTPAD